MEEEVHLKDKIKSGEDDDPDYVSVAVEKSQKQTSLSLQQQDAKDLAVNKIEKIIQDQFALEIRLKEKEVELIDHRISQTKAMLDRLRACVLARYYGTSERLLAGEGLNLRRRTRRTVSGRSGHVFGIGGMMNGNWNGTECNTINKSVDPGLKTQENAISECLTDVIRASERTSSSAFTQSETNKDNSTLHKHEKDCNWLATEAAVGPTAGPITTSQSGGKATLSKAGQNSTTCVTVVGSRFYIKKRIIIGNTSKYIPVERREENDKSTHKWMVYVRGLPDDLPIHSYVQNVWFFLHPSYRPNDIVEIKKPPFQITRRGWGEFPIRVQLHFVDSRNKRVDIIHELKLDKTYTGLQTMGAETVVDLEIERRTFVDLGLPVPVNKPVLSSVNAKTRSPLPSFIPKDEKPINQDDLKVKLDEIIDAGKDSPHGDDITQGPITNASLSTCFSSSTNSQLARSPESPVNIKLERQLQHAATCCPLIHADRNVTRFPYCAASLSQYLSWSLMKRRAAEWQRALHITRHLKSCNISSDLTTKQVMIWCRCYGYTPTPTLPSDQDLLYCCGCGTSELGASDGENVEEDSKEIHLTCHSMRKSPPDTHTTSVELIESLEARERELSRARTIDEEDEDVDVTSIPISRRLGICTQALTTLPTPITVEQLWIKDVCNEIGISLRPVVHHGVEVHAVESALFTLTRRFAEDLMRKALSLSSTSRSTLEPRVLVPGMIYAALRSMECWDFLTNVHTGHMVTDNTIAKNPTS
ncbi:YEATS domain-containing protein 2 [Nematostella vectensis]|uniref:YEATS domain-containing protein 2 n=1 Tax=Nematostella vectensis TaxID=45351 RepID=UPI00138FC567|nr:YEATS domain-containing protein 2 [Nematostella vectensis]